MKTLKLSIIFVTAIIVIIFSCEKKGMIGEKLLTDEMKTQNPYKISDVFTLKDEMGENFIFEVKTRKCTIHEMQFGHDVSRYYLVEVEETRIVSDNTEDSYGIELTAYGNMRDIYFHLSFKSKGYSFNFNLPMTQENTQYVDSIFVQDRWYYDIFMNEIEKVGNRAYKLHYSTSYGIVKVDFSDGSYLELVNEEFAGM
jgi:hypothetical protein